MTKNEVFEAYHLSQRAIADLKYAVLVVLSGGSIKTQDRLMLSHRNARHFMRSVLLLTGVNCSSLQPTLLKGLSIAISKSELGSPPNSLRANLNLTSPRWSIVGCLRLRFSSPRFDLFIFAGQKFNRAMTSVI